MSKPDTTPAAPTEAQIRAAEHRALLAATITAGLLANWGIRELRVQVANGHHQQLCGDAVTITDCLITHLRKTAPAY